MFLFFMTVFILLYLIIYFAVNKNKKNLTYKYKNTELLTSVFLFIISPLIEIAK